MVTARTRPLLAPPFVVGEDANGVTFVDCNVIANIFEVPELLSALEGISVNFSGGIANVVAGGVPCPTDGSPILDCDLVLPVADSTIGFNFHVTALGVFHVTGNGLGDPKYVARFVASLTVATGGQGGTANCGVGSICLVKLVQ